MPIYTDEDDVVVEKRPSLLSQIGSFLWTAIKWIAAAALIITGAVLLSDKASHFVDSMTGGPNKGWGTRLRHGVTDIKNKLTDGFNNATDQVSRATGMHTPTPAELAAADDAARKSFENNKLLGLAVVEGGTVAVTGARLTPPTLKLGADAISQTGVGGKVGSFFGGAMNKLAAAGEAVSTRFKDTVRFFNLTKSLAPTTTAVQTAAPAVTSTATATTVVAAEGTAAASELTGLAAFGSKAAPILEGASKVAPFVGAAVTVGADGWHAVDLAKQGKTGSLAAQGVGTTMEAGSMFLGPIGYAWGSIGKEVVRDIDLIRTGGSPQVTHSAIGHLLADTLGGDQIYDETADYWTGRKEKEAATELQLKKDRLNAIKSRLPSFSEEDKAVMRRMITDARYHGKKNYDMLNAMGDLVHQKADAIKKAGKFARVEELLVEAKKQNPQGMAMITALDIVEKEIQSPGATPAMAMNKPDGQKK